MVNNKALPYEYESVEDDVLECTEQLNNNRVGYFDTDRESRKFSVENTYKQLISQIRSTRQVSTDSVFKNATLKP